MASGVGYETWTGTDWKLTVNGTSYDTEFTTVEFRERVNEPVEWRAVLEGVDTSSADFNRGNVVRFERGSTKAFKGRIMEVNRSSQVQVELNGLGMAVDLQRTTYTDTWTGADTTTIVSEIVGSTMNIGTNNSLNASTDFRADEDVKLEALNRLANDHEGDNNHGGEWWVDEDNSNNDRFNMDTQRGGGSSVKTFRTQGDSANAELAEKKTSRFEGDYDGVVVKGYGDGDDQVQASAGSTGDDDDVLVVTDKTILSDAQAQSRADKLNSEHGGEWKEVKVVPADPHELFDVGDVITVDSSDADISSSDFRIVERTYKVNLTGAVTAEFVCNNKPRTFYNKVEEQKQETQSQTQHMQGSRNVWSEKESDNCSDAEPLFFDFYVPPDINDVTNNDRLKKVYLNYSAAAYRQSAGSVTKGTVESTIKTTNNRIESLGENAVRNEKVTQTSTPSASGGGGKKVTESSQSLTSKDISTTGFTEVARLSTDSSNDGAGGEIHLVFDFDDDSSADQVFQLKIRVKHDFNNDGTVETVMGGTNEILAGVYVLAAEDEGWINKSITLPTPIAAGNDIIVEAQCANGQTTFSVAGRFYQFEQHDHDMEPAHEKDSGRIQSAAIFENSSDSLDDITDSSSDRVSSVSDTMSTGSTATELTDISIKPDGGSYTQISSNTGTKKDKRIDITSHINGDGWYTLRLTPDAVTYLKSRVFLDHHKDSK